MKSRSCGYLFPGQGSQYVGMGIDLCNKYQNAHSFLSIASQVLNFDVIKVMSTGTAMELKETRVSQVSIFLYSLIVAKNSLADENIKCIAVAGHSLGEITALTYVGVLSFSDALLLINKRSKAMQAACKKNKGAMMAIMGLDFSILDDLCKKFNGLVCIANYNSPKQLVISGDSNAVAQLAKLAIVNGAKRAIPLSVSGAFHSPLMDEASYEVSEFIETLTFNDALIPVYQNFDAQRTTSGFDIKKKLVDQITAPVLWSLIIKNMLKDKIEDFFETGPGEILTKLTKQIVES